MTAIEDTTRALNSAREKSDRVVVAYSGGKDSVVVLDLCLRTFAHVEAFHMEFLPDLRCTNEAIEDAERTWGVKVHRVQHWVTTQHLHNGVFCRSGRDVDLPRMQLRDVLDLVKADTKIPLVATGMKRCDGMWRQANMRDWDDVVWPLAAWKNTDVLGYLTRRGLRARLSQKNGHGSFGVGLNRQCLVWMMDNYPDDFEKVAQVFPFVRAVAKLRQLYGTEAALGDVGSTTASPTSATNQRKNRSA